MLIRDRIKELRRVPAAELRPNPENWRTHPKAQADALRGVLAEIGVVDAVLAFPADGNGPDGDFSDLMLFDGHLRVEILPGQDVPVLVTDLTRDEARKAMLTFDPLTDMAKPDAAKLDALLREVETGSEALASMLEDLAKDAGCEWATAGEIVEDEVPEPPVDPVTKPGELWILGEHRLLCGDSTKAEDVARVMCGSKATCVFTDPPYGVSIAAKNRLLNSLPDPKGGGDTGIGRNSHDISDDDLSPEELERRLLPAFINVREIAMDEDCTVFMTAPQGGELGMMMMMMMMQKAGLKVRHVLIWKKNQPTFSMGRLDYDYQHEPILLTWLKRHKRPMRGQHKTSVWEIDKPRKSAEHPTMKPVELYANAYLNNSEDGDTVFDPYCGSGTAIIAAEQSGRRCVAVELEPRYVDVCVKRFENLTNKKAVLEEAK